MTGKTSMMMKFLVGQFDEQEPTLGVHFDEKSVAIKNTTVNIAVW